MLYSALLTFRLVCSQSNRIHNCCTSKSHLADAEAALTAVDCAAFSTFRLDLYVLMMSTHNTSIASTQARRRLRGTIEYVTICAGTHSFQPAIIRSCEDKAKAQRGVYCEFLFLQGHHEHTIVLRGRSRSVSRMGSNRSVEMAT